MEKEKDRTRLMHEIKFHLSNKEILYSSIDDLKKLKQRQDNLFKSYNFAKNKNSNEINEKIEQLIIYLDNHAKKVGEKQAVKDLQIGLSLLNKNRRNSVCECKNLLLDDGDYGAKTYACLCDVCKNYPIEIIKKYIKLGVKNNIIFDTKNNKRVDTEKLINKTIENLEKY